MEGVNQLKVSVCIFSRNPKADEFVKVAEALKRQNFDYRNWELVIIDNNSDKPLEQQFKDLFNWHPNIRFVIEPNKGFPYCHRRVFTEARGELILILADDNILHPDYISKAATIMNDQPDIGVLTGLVKFYSPEGISDFSRRMHDHIYNDGGFTGFVKTNEMKKYSPALRGSAGMVLRHEIGLKYLDVFHVYQLLMDRLKEIGISYLRGTDLDIPMLAMRDGFFIARSSGLVMEHHATYEELRMRKILKSYYIMCLCEQIFRLRWDWAPNTFSNSEFIINFAKGLMNINRIGVPAFLLRLSRELSIRKFNLFLNMNKSMTIKLI